MKKKCCLFLLLTSLVICSCAQMPPDREIESVTVENTTEESTSALASTPVTEETTTTEQTTTVCQTTASAQPQIPVGENIYAFSADNKDDKECYFELSYHEDGEKMIQKISFYSPVEEEMVRAWHFGFTQRTDFLFVRRTERETGGFRFMYVYETYDTFETDGIEYEEFRAASAVLWFTPGMGMVHSKEDYRTDIGYKEQRKASQLARWRSSYFDHSNNVEKIFEFDRDQYQYDILYGYVDGVEYIMEEDVKNLPKLPFEIPMEYGAEKYW